MPIHDALACDSPIPASHSVPKLSGERNTFDTTCWRAVSERHCVDANNIIFSKKGTDMSDLSECTTPLDEQILYARLRGTDSFRIMRLALTQALRHLDDQAARYDAADDLEAQAACLNHTMKYLVSDLMPRLRLDSAADSQAALLLAAARKVTA
jgi:hypothetical protein